MSRGIAGSLIPAGRAFEVGKGGNVADAAGTPLAANKYLQGTPDWWLATLPGQKGVRVVEQVNEQSYSASAADTAIPPTIVVNEGESLVLLRYRFFCKLPDVGGRFTFAGEADTMGFVVWRMLFNNNDLFEYTYAKTSNGIAIVHDRLHDGVEPIPLFIHGKGNLILRYTVVAAPSFTIQTIGFYIYGFVAPTKTLDDIAKR